MLLGFVMNRRGGARWLQLPVLVLHTGVVFVASAFITLGDWGAVVELLLLAGLVLAVVGWVLCLVPPAHRWFRHDGTSRRRRRSTEAGATPTTSASHERITAWQASTAVGSSSGLPAIARQRWSASTARAAHLVGGCVVGEAEASRRRTCPRRRSAARPRRPPRAAARCRVVRAVESRRELAELVRVGIQPLDRARELRRVRRGSASAG